MKLKLKSSALEILDDGKAYHGGRLFTGVAITEERGRIVSARELEDGVEVGDYRSSYLEAPEDAASISTLMPGLEGDPEYNEPVTLDGVRLNGVVLEFDGIHCVRESLFEEGVPKIEVSWHSNGALATYEYFHRGTAAEFYWDEDAARSSLRLMKPDGTEVTMDFEAALGLSRLRALGNYFAGEPDPVLETLPFFAISETTGFAEVDSAQSLTLDGEAVTPELFRQLAANDGLRELRTLSACDTGLEAGDIALLSQAPHLSSVTFEDTKNLLEPALTALKTQRTDLEVTYNGRALTVPTESDPAG